MSDQPVARPLPTQDNTTQKDADKHPCLERDSNPRDSVRAFKAQASNCAATGSAIKYLHDVNSSNIVHVTK
jgi:hypothetical protein